MRLCRAESRTGSLIEELAVELPIHTAGAVLVAPRPDTTVILSLPGMGPALLALGRIGSCLDALSRHGVSG